LDARLIVAKSEDVKTGWYNSRQSWQNLLRKAMPKKIAVLPMMMMICRQIHVIAATALLESLYGGNLVKSSITRNYCSSQPNPYMSQVKCIERNEMNTKARQNIFG
jgi:hypothetical protein